MNRSCRSIVRAARLASLAFAVAACGEPAPRSVRAPAPDSSPAAPLVAYRALGTEPFWALGIDGAGLRLTTPEDSAGARWAAVARRVEGDTQHWTATGARGTIDARLWPARCSDGMSDRAWTHSAVVRAGAVTYRGCAAVDSAAGSR